MIASHRVRLGCGDNIYVHIVENQLVHLVGKPARRGPGYAYYDDPLAHGPEGVDNVDEVRVSGDQYVSADIGVGMGAFDAVRRHFDVDAVLDTGSAPGGGSRIRQPSGHVHGIDAGGIQGRRVVDKLARPAQFRGPGYPVGVGFSDYDTTVVGDFFFQCGYIGETMADSQTYFEVLPIEKEGYVSP